MISRESVNQYSVPKEEIVFIAKDFQCSLAFFPFLLVSPAKHLRHNPGKFINKRAKVSDVAVRYMI